MFQIYFITLNKAKKTGTSTETGRAEKVGVTT